MSNNGIDQAAYERAQRILAANLSPRYTELGRLKSYVIGNQYNGRPSWWKDDVPLLERAPCVQYPIAARAVDSNVDLVLGDGRWPTITSHPGEDDTAFDDAFGLSEDESKDLDRFVKGLVEHARLQSACDELLTEGQSSRTAVAICYVRDGCIKVESIEAKTATPAFSETNPGEVLSLEIKYPYLDRFYDDERRCWSFRVLMYRRVIDADKDVVFEPVLANEHGQDITPSMWRPKKNGTVEHNLGFCPVIWHRFRPRTGDVSSIDGRAIHEQVLNEIDAVNRSWSQHHRAALYAGDPQIIEIGVEDGDVTAPTGRQPNPQAFQHGDPEANLAYGGGNVRGVAYSEVARKRGAGTIWRYANPNSKVEYLVLPEGALATLKDDGERVLELLKEALAVVFIDPANTKISGDISGRALEILHKKQIERCDKIRGDFGDNCLLPLVHMLLRMVYVVAKRGDMLYIPGIKTIMPVLTKFAAMVKGDAGNDNARWFKPYIKLMWGPYFRATSTDAKLDHEMVTLGIDKMLITKESAVRKLAPHYPDISDVPQYLETLEAEEEERTAKMHDAQVALMGGEAPGDAVEPEDSAQVAQEPGASKRHTAQRGKPKPVAPGFRKRFKAA